MIILTSLFLRYTKINGITLFPFILLRNKALREDKILLNHERIHLRQQAELGILPFYLWYTTEYVYWYLRLKNKNLAYRNILFEREAYAEEADLAYLRKRKFWNFLRYRS